MSNENGGDLNLELQDILRRCAELKRSAEEVISSRDSKFKLGDHLIVSRGLYTHHGIYAGSNRVIHYSGFSEGFTSGPVIYDTIEIFARGSEISIRDYSSTRFEGQEIVDRATRRLGENEYDLHSNNCEDFCSWAITGKARSEQVEFVESMASVILPTISSAAQMRKHISRKKLQGEDGSITGDIVKTAATGAAYAVLPISVPVLVVGLALRRLFK